ncbi:MAG TPA: ATP-binding protein [Ktedonobacteraceae bacterium]|nr:ATP-binding protein [Ktedonobacteraceae bacterium]
MTAAPLLQRLVPIRRARKRTHTPKRRIALRLRIALISAALALVGCFTLVLFINTIALGSFPQIIRVNPAFIVKIVERHSLPHGISIPNNGANFLQLNPLERALLLELRTISLIGFGLVALVTGVGAYWLAGYSLRPVQRVSEAARRISASTLNTRLALDGPNDEIKELADTFDAMLERLQLTFDSQGRFMGDVAHELRTPLASLRTNLEVVSSDPQATLEDYREMSAAQERALTRLERLVADLLILARSEQPPVRASVALGPLLEEVCSDLQCAAASHRITLELQSDLDVMVRGDSTLLARVFSNLVENGIHYNHPGGKVTLSLDQKQSLAIVLIVDTGIGIPAEQQTRIFERFYRADSSHTCHQGGVGLGLSIVAAITQQHGGQAQVESAPGEGSIFTIVLPIESTPTASPASSAT